MTLFSRSALRSLVEGLPAPIRLKLSEMARETITQARGHSDPVLNPRITLLVGAPGTGNLEEAERTKKLADLNTAVIITEPLKPKIGLCIYENKGLLSEEDDKKRFKTIEDARVWVARTAVNALSDPSNGTRLRHNLVYPCNNDALTRRGLIEHLSGSGYKINLLFFVAPMQEALKHSDPYTDLDFSFNQHVSALAAIEKAMERPELPVSLFWRGELVAVSNAHEPDIQITDQHGLERLMDEVTQAQDPTKRDISRDFKRLVEIRRSATRYAPTLHSELTQQ